MLSLSGSHARICSPSLPPVKLVTPPPPLPLTSYLGKYSLATLLLACKQRFIANIFLVFLSLLICSSTLQSMISARQGSTSTAQAFLPPIWLPPFNLDLHSFLTLLIYPAFFLPFILVLIVWSCWNSHTICSPHLQLHCVGHLVGRFHCCPISFLFSFPRHLTCLAKTTFWFILITSLPLFDAMNNRWSMGLVSSASLYSAFISINTRVSEKKNSKANNVSSDVNLPKLHCTWCHHRLSVQSAVTDYKDFILGYPNHLKIHE